MSVDDLLCNASEVQLRNVLAMSGLSDAELIALFEREEKMDIAESQSKAETNPRHTSAAFIDFVELQSWFGLERSKSQYSLGSQCASIHQE